MSAPTTDRAFRAGFFCAIGAMIGNAVSYFLVGDPTRAIPMLIGLALTAAVVAFYSRGGAR